METNNIKNKDTACVNPNRPGSKHCCDYHKNQHHNAITKEEKAQNKNQLIDSICKTAVLENDLKHRDKELETTKQELGELKEVLVGVMSREAILTHENTELKTRNGQLEQAVKSHEINYQALISHCEVLTAHINKTQLQPPPVNVPPGGQVLAAAPEPTLAKKETMFGWFGGVW